MTAECCSDIMEEIYKNIQDYEGLYQISNLGNVKSLPRTWKTGKNKFGYDFIQTKIETIMQSALNLSGYLAVPLSKNGETKTFRVHHLVWDMFGDILRNGLGLQVDHKDENKLNNHIDNLQLLTPRENVIKHHRGRGRFCYGTHKSGKKYCSQITINGKLKYLGTFLLKEDAENAYKKEAGLL